MYHSLNYDTRGKTVSSVLQDVALDDASKGWLLQNVDPFHDNQFRMAAPPTPSMLDSTVQCRRVRVNVTPDDAGNVHLFFPPVPVAGPLYVDRTTILEYGGIMQARGGAEGSTSPYWYKPMASLDKITDGPYRLVGMGWEVINTTPEMYKSGSLLVYQCPQVTADTGYTSIGQVYVGLSTNGTEYFTGRLKQLPVPYDAESATTLPSSK